MLRRVGVFNVCSAIMMTNTICISRPTPSFALLHFPVPLFSYIIGVSLHVPAFAHQVENLPAGSVSQGCACLTSNKPISLISGGKTLILTIAFVRLVLLHFILVPALCQIPFKYAYSLLWSGSGTCGLSIQLRLPC